MSGAVMDVNVINFLRSFSLKVAKMKRCGVAVLERRQTGLMHNKFAIIDSRILITGSFNWTTQVHSQEYFCTSSKIHQLFKLICIEF